MAQNLKNVRAWGFRVHHTSLFRNEQTTTPERKKRRAGRRQYRVKCGGSESSVMCVVSRSQSSVTCVVQRINVTLFSKNCQQRTSRYMLIQSCCEFLKIRPRPAAARVFFMIWKGLCVGETPSRRRLGRESASGFGGGGRGGGDGGDGGWGVGCSGEAITTRLCLLPFQSRRGRRLVVTSLRGRGSAQVTVPMPAPWRVCLPDGPPARERTLGTSGGGDDEGWF